jgi:hypothetical protein
MRPPRDGAARSLGPNPQEAGDTHTNANGTARSTASPTRSITQARRLAASAAFLADDVATLAAQSGRAPHAHAAVHLLDTAQCAWLAAEALAESEGVRS